MAKKRRRYIRKQNSGTFLPLVGYVLIFLIVIVALTFFFRSPQLQPMRDSAIYSLVLTILLFTVMIYFTWFHCKRPPLKGQLFSTLLMIRLLMPVVISSDQIMLLIDTVLLLLLGGYVIFMYIYQNQKYAVLDWEFIIVTIYYISCCFDYEFVYRPRHLHFGTFSLVLAFIITAITAFLLINGRIRPKNKRQSNKLLTLAIVFFFSFVLFRSVACHFNYALDRNAPDEFMAIIEEKDIQSGGRGSVYYTFFLQLSDSSIKLDVSQSEYYAYKIGDTFPVELYQGAFNEPFYISGNK